MLALATLIGIATTYFGVKLVMTNAPPAPSYQEKNLAVLKSAQSNDLVLCLGEKSSSSQQEVTFAFLVDMINSYVMTGWNLDTHHLSRKDGGWNLLFASRWECEMRVVKEPLAQQTIGRIIMYGPNPPPAK
ncbi:MAG: hypothetical protein QG581_487 [Patescibacteria group bacterium]|jgi:hypothetical protein|nr:hypothetical protein [Patescibacteria group bacterium]